MNVVSNSSPLIFLSKLNRLDILEHCFTSVHIPDDVRLELGSMRVPDHIEIQALSEIGKGFVAGAVGRLHKGELAAMRLAIETRADLLLMDDLAARHKATRLGLRVMGTLGVLVLANHQGHISSKLVLEEIIILRDIHNLYLTDALLAQIASALR